MEDRNIQSDRSLLQRREKNIEKIWKFAVFALLLMGVTTFFTGTHNIDNAWNLNRVNSMIINNEIRVVETNILGIQINATSTYNLGTAQTLAGFIISLIAVFLMEVRLWKIKRKFSLQ